MYPRPFPLTEFAVKIIPDADRVLFTPGKIASLSVAVTLEAEIMSRYDIATQAMVTIRMFKG